MRQMATMAASLALLLLAGAAGAGAYYVSLQGDDDSDGLSEDTAWRTIAHAAEIAEAGDTVLVAPGDYGDERVVFANSSEDADPIVFRGHGGRPQLSSDHDEDPAFFAEGKAGIHIRDFDIIGYGYAVLLRDCDRCHVRDLRCLGRGGGIRLIDACDYCWIDGCYVEDTYRNAILIYGDAYYDLQPCSFNTISNCTVVRGGHSSIDVHTCCPDSYVVGCVVRERGKERDGRTAACGFYFHNHHIDRLYAIGNVASDVHWGPFLGGGSDCVLAENLSFDVAKAYDLDYSQFRDVSWRGMDRVDAPCVRNVMKDNVIFDISRASLRMSGAQHNIMIRNYSDGGPDCADYYCHDYCGQSAAGNVIVDPAGGVANITVGSPDISVWRGVLSSATGATLELLRDGEIIAVLEAGDRAELTELEPGSYVLRTVHDEQGLPAPPHLRVMAMPEGGAAIVWMDCYLDEDGFILERKTDGDWSLLAELPADSSRYVDREIGLEKATYRVRAVRNAERSAASDEDEIARGRWLTDRTGLDIRGAAGFALMDDGECKTLVVQDVTRAGIGDEVWLRASRPVTGTIWRRAGCIRAAIDEAHACTLQLQAPTRHAAITFSGEPVQAQILDGTIALEIPGPGWLRVGD